MMSLKDYHKKRDFKKTPEPKGAVSHQEQHLYIIQKHAASHLHYDFRLELNGVLLSWAVPKGPSFDPAVKRLAIHVEDHPVSYGSFEGIIPKGSYGAGTVMLWDKGTWESLDEDPVKSYKKGHLRFKLNAKKLKGRWDLLRFKDDKHWFLIKYADEFAQKADDYDILQEEPDSVISNQSIDEIAEDYTHIWTKKDFVITHPEKVLYPDDGFTKQDLLNYYESISDWILPFIKNRALSLVRCPENMNQCFYQRHYTSSTPKALKSIAIDTKKETEQYIYLNDTEGLLSLVQMGVLEIHPWGSLITNIEKPDVITIDLDPDPDISWKKVVEAALEIRAHLAQFKLSSFVKTTGGKGLHVVIPIKPEYDWEEIKNFTHVFVTFLERLKPDEYISKMSKTQRKGKIFIDYLRNQRGATAVAAYSTRARIHAPISVPLAWDELSSNKRNNEFTLKTLPERLELLKQDPWDEYHKIKQSLPLNELKMG